PNHKATQQTKYDIESKSISNVQDLLQLTQHQLILADSLDSQLSLEEHSADGMTSISPYFTKTGLIHHALSLKNPQHDTTVELTPVQLLDLVNALEEYKTDLKKQFRPDHPETNSSNIPAWFSSAAAVVVSVGLATLGGEIYNFYAARQAKDTVASESKTEYPAPTLETIPPPIPEKETQNLPPPLEVPKDLTSISKLPPPPAVDQPKPQPNIPDPSLLDLPVPPPTPQPNINIQARNQDNKVVPRKIQNNEQIARNQPLPPPVVLENSKKKEPPILPDAPVIKPKSSLRENFTAEDMTVEPKQKKTSDIEVNNSQSSQNKPELVAVKQYFANKWQPPEGLTQVLQYRLRIGENGTIQSITPIGKAAEIYLDRTEIPLIGENFIPPSSIQSNSTVRVVLNPDGSVQTFAE
ncbi:MAG: DUF4335 domain-containing protein, partial [Cyanobacteria bacterium J083]